MVTSTKSAKRSTTARTASAPSATKTISVASAHAVVQGNNQVMIDRPLTQATLSQFLAGFPKMYRTWAPGKYRLEIDLTISHSASANRSR